MWHKLFSQNAHAQWLINTATVLGAQQINQATQACQQSNTQIERDPTSGNETTILPSDNVIQQCVEETLECAAPTYADFSGSLDEDTNTCMCEVTQEQIDEGGWSGVSPGPIGCSDLPVQTNSAWSDESSEGCPFGIQTNLEGEPLLDENGQVSCVANNYGTLGISCSPEQLQKGECTLNVSQLLGVREEQWNNNTIMTWAQDAILAGTSFIGVVMTISIIVIWFKYLRAGANRWQAADARKALLYTLIGFVLVVCSVVVIRLVQYLIAG